MPSTLKRSPASRSFREQAVGGGVGYANGLIIGVCDMGFVYNV